MVNYHHDIVALNKEAENQRKIENKVTVRYDIYRGESRNYLTFKMDAIATKLKATDFFPKIFFLSVIRFLDLLCLYSLNLENWVCKLCSL